MCILELQAPFVVKQRDHKCRNNPLKKEENTDEVIVTETVEEVVVANN